MSIEHPAYTPVGVWRTLRLPFIGTPPRAGSGVVRIDPLRFLTGCRKRQLKQALSVLSLSLGFFRVCMLCC